MSPRFSRIPRGEPEFLGRWELHGSFWFLTILDRNWGSMGSAWTDAPAHEPHPDGEGGWLAKIGFTVADDGPWIPQDHGWERAVRRMPAGSE